MHNSLNKTIFLLLLLTFGIGHCQTDTIAPCQRFGRYLYDSLWADSFSQNCQGSCDIRGSIWETVHYRPAIVLRKCHTDTTIQISGIAAPIYFDTTLDYADSNRLPEYYYIYAQTDTGITELASVRWDNTIPQKVMQFYGLTPYGFPGGVGNDIPYGDRVSTYPVYEARFDKPISVNGTFFVGGSTNNNYRVAINTFAHPGTRYLRWSFKYQLLSTNCLNSIPRPEDNDLIMYTGSSNDDISDTAFHSNMLLWPGFGCIFPILYSPEDTAIAHNDTCFGPSGLRVLDISERNVVITWGDNNSTNGWELSIVKGDTASAVPENGIINSLGTNIAYLYGLDSSWYSVYVRTVCKEELTSEWSSPIRFLVPKPEPTGISIADKQTRIEPNPTKGIFDVCSSVSINTITIVSPEGKTIKKQNVDSLTARIDIGQYPAGTYIVHIQTIEGAFTKRIVKK